MKKKAKDLKPGDKISINGVTGVVARVVDLMCDDGKALVEMEPMSWEDARKMRGDKISSAEDWMNGFEEFLGANLEKGG